VAHYPLYTLIPENPSHWKETIIAKQSLELFQSVRWFMTRWSKLSVKLLMKQTIFFLILIFFVGCAQQETPKPEAPATVAEVASPTASEPKTTNIVSEKVLPTTVEAAPEASKKIDYDAINKSILKDVSKKIVDKASKKD